MNSGTDVVVIGGGVVGLAVARRLRREGANVTLIDRSDCGREASWAGAGIIAPCNPHRDDPIYHLHERSLAAFPTFCDELRAESGIDPEYDRAGALELLLTDQAVQIARSDIRAAQAQRTADGRMVLEYLEPDQSVALEPIISTDILGAVECRKTAIVRNPRLLQAAYTSCQRAGVNLVEHAPVTELVVVDDRICGVRTTSQFTEAKSVVLCAGAWSSQLHPSLATAMPVHPVRGQMILLKLPERRFTHVISRGKFYLVPRRDGHVLLGSTEEPEAGFVKRCTPQGINKLFESAVRMVPSLTDAPVEAMWSGLRPGTPDDKPYLGSVPGIEGIIAATGHFRAGLTLAPVTAEYVAAILSGRGYDLDLACCTPGRNR